VRATESKSNKAYPTIFNKYWRAFIIYAKWDTKLIKQPEFVDPTTKQPRDGT
jgi:hypothetical protein